MKMGYCWIGSICEGAVLSSSRKNSVLWVKRVLCPYYRRAVVMVEMKGSVVCEVSSALFW